MRRTVALSALTVLILAAAPPSALAGEHTRDFAFAAEELVVTNLVGGIEVVPADGDVFEVRVTVRGADAAADRLEFAVEEGRRARLAVVFPLEDHDAYVYPELGRNSRTTIRFEDEGGSWLKKVLSGLYGKKVTVAGRGDGLEVWADVTVGVPRGRALEVRHGVGRISAADLAADLTLDTHAGPIRVARVEGDVRCDTGSGSVEVADLRGDLVADTGSGGVELAGIDCEELVVDTGSGSVEARGVRADGAKIDTGSGGVELALDRMGAGEFVVDTGSGSIRLVLPPDASARVTVDTGSGRIHNEVAGAVVRLQERDELEMTVGGGDARVRLDAGSGSVTISGG